MADAKLKIIISAQDQASGTLGSIGKALAGLGGLARGALTAGVGLAAGSLASLGAVLVTSAGEAMAAEEVQAQLNAVLKSTGGIAGVTAEMAGDLAGSLSRVTRFEDEAVLSGENLLLTFTNIGKEIFPETTEMALDMSQALGQDLKSSAVQLGKALNDPIRGITALTRVGVSFTAEQKKEIKALQESGDLLGAQRIILRELQREFGGAARAAGGTLAGQLDILRNAMSNVQEGIGTALLPGLTTLAQALGPVLMDGAERLGAWLTTAGPKFATFATNVGGVASAISDFGLASPQALTALQTLFGDKLGKGIQDAGVWLGTAAGNLKDLVTAYSSDGWNSTAMQTALKNAFGGEAAQGIKDAVDWFGRLGTIMTKIENFAGIDPTKLAGWDAPVKTNMGLLGDLQGAFEDLRAAFAGGIHNPFAALADAINGAASALRILLGLQAQAAAGFGGGGFSGGGGASGGGAGGGGSKFAGGTPWAPGGWALVGERGPELVRLPSGSRVYPADRSSRLGGGWNVSINVSGVREGRAAGQAVELGVLRAAREMGVR